MSLTVVSIAYPFAPVTADPAGGAEQVLAQLDRALVAAGHRSIVIAAAGSRVAGELVALAIPDGAIDDEQRARAHADVRAALAAVLAREAVDLVHCHGIDFDGYRPPLELPTLVTLHLPLDWYAPGVLAPRARTSLLPVSASQAARAPAGLALLAPIGNGVDTDAYRPAVAKGRYALVLGRVAPEKGFADAIEAARLGGVSLIAAGKLYPYAAHRAYFEDEVVPRLDGRCRWIGPVEGAAKRRLLARARCLLVPSTAPETSSLVAMEALASGTPVIAYRSGALPEVVEDGATGFIVDDKAGIADAIGRIGTIDPARCRRAAIDRFSLARTTRAYFDLFERLAA